MVLGHCQELGDPFQGRVSCLFTPSGFHPPPVRAVLPDGSSGSPLEASAAWGCWMDVAASPGLFAGAEGWLSSSVMGGHPKHTFGLWDPWEL